MIHYKKKKEVMCSADKHILSNKNILHEICPWCMCEEAKRLRAMKKKKQGENMYA